MITTIVFSKDRPAQLDLLLRSIERNGNGWFERTRVIWKGEGYDSFLPTPRTVGRFRGREDRGDFEAAVRFYLSTVDVGEFVCFMCDDGILYRSLPDVPTTNEKEPTIVLRSNEKLLCFSLRLGWNTRICYPSGLTQLLPADWAERGTVPWDWTRQPQDPGVSDFGYPGSIDGHVFRTADVQRMLAGRSFPNPTALECALVDGCRELARERPLMACYPQSVYVGNPINRVSEQSNVRFGSTYPVSAEECNRRFLAGERIDLDRLDFSGVNGAHTEIELIWSTPS